MKDLKRTGVQFKYSVGLILYNTLIYHTNKAVNSRLKVISLRRNKKLIKLSEQQKKSRKNKEKRIHREILHNYSTYTLSDEQYETLSFGLDTHIPVKVNKNEIYAEFEIFFQSLLTDISNIPDNELRQIKTNFRNTSDNYTKIKAPYKCRKVLKELSEIEDIAILKADKGREILIMNREKSMGNGLQILNTNQFVKINSDRTKTTQRKVQNVLQKIKLNFFIE